MPDLDARRYVYQPEDAGDSQAIDQVAFIWEELVTEVLGIEEGTGALEGAFV